ncbi:LicD family protein [Methanobrevibacter oralis]|uniref:LicD family protein n=1 Tax=Methanobrevibacter oralis TaxID=66851 RepID=UPI001C73ADB1|nr:LicD family protein [Methanobrevibacter oralis]
MRKIKKYDDDTLKHLQKVSLMILKDFIEICEENDLTYFVYGGTLLGAIRHQGFIPWDDDVDVIMFRKDFDKLNEIFLKDNNPKYDFFNVINEEDYFYTFGRLGLKGTKFEEWWAKQVNYETQIFIDIFILDNIPNNKIKRFFQKYLSFILNQLTIYSVIKYENFSRIKEIIQRSLYYLLKIIPIKSTSIKQRCVNMFSKYKNENCEELCDFPAICQMPIYNKDDFKHIKKFKFEDIEVNVPNNYDKVLTRIYGDYMELPPKDKRFAFAPEKIDFGKY